MGVELWIGYIGWGKRCRWRLLGLLLLVRNIFVLKSLFLQGWRLRIRMLTTFFCGGFVGTVEEKMLAIQSRKSELAGAVTSPEESKLRLEDLMALFD